ncbi:hypothetical protein JCGZ_16616 [Jatropha curcas]|uniref:beta-galactosidase n=1 Tax=Jatropha curcas TaxID=180498 RepID=A0A067JZF1_JATCU|nr:hypothetical protein JCGZ_16616 [Jatropha curcas]
MASSSSSSYFAIVSGLSLAIFLSLISHSFAVTYDNRAIIINGDRKIIISGSIYYPRSTPGMWPKLIKQAKLGGLNAIETYVFWNAHEPQHRQCGTHTFWKTKKENTCHAIDSVDVVQKACLNQKNCTLDVNINKFALLPQEWRQIFSYRLAVEAVC